jgi:DNA-binding CsgD family transcriptional regulator
MFLTGDEENLMSTHRLNKNLHLQHQIEQPHQDETIPDVRILRRRFLDERRRDTPGPVLDCVAHMLLYIDQPDMLLEVALSYLVRTLAVCRGDAGVSAPHLPLYTPSAIYLDPRREAPTMLGVSLPNKHPITQLVWHTNGPVRFEQVEQNLVIGDLREAFMSLRSRSMVARRLEHRNTALGLLCLDHTEESHIWEPRELALVDDFCQEFLAPILLYSLQLSKRLPPVRSANALTSAELEVVRLAAEGLTYSEIAATLHKSVRTVDNQLRSAREKLGARNQIDLVRLSSPFL